MLKTILVGLGLCATAITVAIVNDCMKETWVPQADKETEEVTTDNESYKVDTVAPEKGDDEPLSDDELCELWGEEKKVGFFKRMSNWIKAKKDRYVWFFKDTKNSWVNGSKGQSILKGLGLAIPVLAGIITGMLTTPGFGLLTGIVLALEFFVINGYALFEWYCV